MNNERKLFWACFIALIATAFGFSVRAMVLDTWADKFHLDKVEMGQITGVGLWPFAISIVLFSLVIDKIGYGRAMAFAFACHVAFVVITIKASGYWGLYIGNLIFALGNGAVEAVINPVVATMFSKEKPKWLNILHAGWPGGLVLAGLLTIAMKSLEKSLPWLDWKYEIALILAPTLIYGLMMLTCKFPLNERVVAGVGYKDMLREFGMVGAAIVVALMIVQAGDVFAWSYTVQAVLGGVLIGTFGLYTMSLGRPLLIFLLLVMIPLATTELGTDSWITSLMEPQMTIIGLQAGWVLVYTSFIMMLLRFSAGPIVHRLSPLGLLAASAAIASVGLVALSAAAGLMILAAATLYAFGKTFFWPTMLGVVSEQFPKGGALTLNATGGVGMLGVGVIGAVFLGYIQDSAVNKQLAAENSALHEKVTVEKHTVFGVAQAVDPKKFEDLSKEDKATIAGIEATAKKKALATVAIFPAIMFVCYLGLLAYFKSIGGYKADVLAGHAAVDEQFTGGVVGPIEA